MVLFVTPESIHEPATSIYDVLDARAFADLESFRARCAGMMSDHLRALLETGPTLWFKWPEFDSFLHSDE